MKEKRRGLSQDFIHSASLSIEYTALSQIQNLKTVMVYLSAFKEPKTRGIITSLLNSGIKTVVPISNTDTFTITPSELTSIDTLKHGAYGIYEPKECIPVAINEIDAALIPGIAFSKNGGRLGFGKGYYDRFLSDFRGLKIGICYDFQVTDTLPTEIHDVKMDLIITEKRTYNDF